jgi:hypothetical protein
LTPWSSGEQLLLEEGMRAAAGLGLEGAQVGVAVPLPLHLHGCVQQRVCTHPCAPVWVVCFCFVPMQKWAHVEGVVRTRSSKECLARYRMLRDELRRAHGLAPGGGGAQKK